MTIFNSKLLVYQRVNMTLCVHWHSLVIGCHGRFSIVRNVCSQTSWWKQSGDAWHGRLNDGISVRWGSLDFNKGATPPSLPFPSLPFPSLPFPWLPFFLQCWAPDSMSGPEHHIAAPGPECQRENARKNIKYDRTTSPWGSLEVKYFISLW